MKQTVRRIATSTTLLIVTVLVLVYALTGFLLAPYLIERTIPGYVQENLGVPTTIGKVRVNPFLLKVEANDFQIGAAGGQPVLAFSRLFVDLELKSLLRWAWTFADVELDQLRINAQIGRDGRLNLADLAERWSKGRPSQPAQKPPRVIVQHVALRAATLTFTDLSQPKPASAKSDAINLDVTQLATIPEREGRYTVSAQLPGGGTLSWQGELALQPIASKGEWRLAGLKLATVWQFFRDEMNLAEPRGNLSIAGRYDFSYDNGAVALALQGVHAQVAGLSLTREGGQRPLIALQTMEATDARYDLAKDELVVPRVKLANGTWSAALSSDGTLDWQNLLKQMARAKAPQKKSASAPFRVRLDALAVDNVGVRYTDRTRAAPLDYAATLHASGKLDVTSGAETTRVTGENIQITLGDVSLKGASSADALADVKSVGLNGGRVDTAARTVTIDTLSIKGGSAALTRAADGRIALIDAFAPGRASNGQAAANGKSTAETHWQYVVHAAEASGLHVALVDGSYKPVVRYDVEVTSAALKNIASDAKAPIQVNAALRVAQGGTINGSGTLAQDFKQANFQLEAAGINAEPLRPLLARYTVLELKSGNASAVARLDYRSGSKPAMRVEGNAKILNLLVNEADTGDRFVSWKALVADSVALTLSPNRMTVKEIRVFEPGAKIVVAKDRSVNITQVLKDRGEAKATTSASQTSSDRFRVRVARIGLQGGTLDFADNSLVLPFATRVRRLNGAMVGLSSAPQSRAELKLDGVIDPNGSARAAGSLKPADPKSFLDINVKFDNVEMPPLSPYTATFAGRKIAAGRLWLDIQYKIVDSQLLGENKIEMADFQLGERVQSPTALDLPLDLAVALLKEPDGRIHLAVPVRGDVDNPKFDYGELIRDAIANTLKRIVTAPFRFIAGVLGGGKGNEDLQSVDFDPGSARLTPPVREQLQKVAQALKERQQLKLVVHGAYDSQRDAQAVRNENLRRAIAQQLGLKLRPGQDPGPIAFDDPDVQRALEKLFAAHAGEDAIQKFASEYAKRSGKEPQRVNPLLAVFHRGRGDRDFYEALFERLVQIEPLSDAALPDLAEQRARAIADFVAHTGVDAGRIAVGNVQTMEDHSKPVAARLALEAA
jgi:uncharacterized protein DUF748